MYSYVCSKCEDRVARHYNNVYEKELYAFACKCSMIIRLCGKEMEMETKISSENNL